MGDNKKVAKFQTTAFTPVKSEINNKRSSLKRQNCYEMDPQLMSMLNQSFDIVSRPDMLMNIDDAKVNRTGHS